MPNWTQLNIGARVKSRFLDLKARYEEVLKESELPGSTIENSRFLELLMDAYEGHFIRIKEEVNADRPIVSLGSVKTEVEQE